MWLEDEKIDGTRHRRAGGPGRWLGAMAALLIAAMAAQAWGVTQLKRGEEAPTIALKGAANEDVGTAALKGKIAVIVFGEIYHEKTRQACARIDAAVHDPRLKGEPIAVMLVTLQGGKAQDVTLGTGEKLPETIVQDVERKAFGDYDVAVMPSVVVIDKEGKVVHAVGGLSSRLEDVVRDSLLHAAGKLSLQAFEQSLDPQPAAVNETQMRAERLAQLARQLGRRGLDELAIEKYGEALNLDPHRVAAHEEMGVLLLRRKRLAEAEKHFRAVLAEDKSSTPAKLGLATLEALRGGPELNEAERTVREVLEKNPAQPQAHYVMGLICEQRGKSEDAAASFKKAAQLLLERRVEE